MLCGCCVALVGVKIVPAIAAIGDNPASVPLARDEPHHHLVFQNDIIRLLRVLIPAGGATLWHEHNFDFVVIAVNGTKVQIELPGESHATEGTMVTGSIAYTNYAGRHFVHRIANRDDALNHQLAFEILVPSPGEFIASDRSSAPQYKMETDNERIRVWRLKLAPGEIAELINQRAPALHAVLQGDRLLETGANGRVRETAIKSGDFAWLPGPAARAVTNAGPTPLEIAEVELK
jgi:hypothetical protein